MLDMLNLHNGINYVLPNDGTSWTFVKLHTDELDHRFDQSSEHVSFMDD